MNQVTPSIVYTYSYDSNYKVRAHDHPIIDYFDNNFSPEIKFNIVINMVGTFREAFEFITSDIPDYKAKFAEVGKFIVHNEKLLISGSILSENPFEIINRECVINMSGSFEEVEKVYQRLKIYDRNNMKALVYWWYKTKDSIRNVSFLLNKDDNFRPEFYPWLGNANDYIERFENSKSNILILLGEPGTGKTSLIRNMITRKNQHCYTTYDQDVMNSDEIYINFLSANDVRYLVLEDSDLLLTDRMHTGNRVMSKMLNAADGLISFKNKKIIFTANIRDKKSIDEALVRPGRCFDVCEFRSLNKEEAGNAASSAGIDFEAELDNYSLAEIFNKNREERKPCRSRFGFETNM